MTITHLDASEFYALAVEYANDYDLDIEEVALEWLDDWAVGHTAAIPTKVDRFLMRVARGERNTLKLREEVEKLF